MFGNTTLTVSLLLLISLCSIQSILSLRCYECLNCADASCSCGTLVETNTADSYCALVREKRADQVTFEIQRLPRNSTGYYESNPYFISVRELISYDQASDRWITHAEEITFGCQTDECNRPGLLKDLPANGLSLRLPSDWLNDNLRRKPDQKATACHDCPTEAICEDRPNFVNPSQCQITPCESVCAMAERVRKGQTSPFCYELFCVASDSQPPAIYLTGVYYINNREFELVETDIVCAGADCSRLEIFQDIKDNLQKDYSGIQPFLPANSVSSISASATIILTMVLMHTTIFA